MFLRYGLSPFVAQQARVERAVVQPWVEAVIPRHFINLPKNSRGFALEQRKTRRLAHRLPLQMTPRPEIRPSEAQCAERRRHLE